MEQQLPSDATESGATPGSDDRCIVVDLRGDKLKEFIKVVHDVIPVLDHMKDSIEESSHKIPHASLQLNSVTQATESATVEILNVLDSMNQRYSHFDVLLGQVADRDVELEGLRKEIGLCLTALASRHSGDETIDRATKLWSDYVQRSSTSEIISHARESLAEVQKEAMSIAMALQVQDITSQQIAGVISLIESVRTQLAQVLSSLEGDVKILHAGERDSAATPRDARNDAFNSDAKYTRDPQRQEMADDIINKWSGTSPQKTE